MSADSKWCKNCGALGNVEVGGSNPLPGRFICLFLIFVYDDSSPYYENIDIDKSISLIGENEDTTVIDGNKSGDVVKITAKGVTLSCFTIQNSGEEQFDFGVEIQSDCNKILGNNIKNNGGLNDWICGGIFW